MSDILLTQTKRTARPLKSILEEYKVLLLNQGKTKQWNDFQRTSILLENIVLADLLANYLTYIAQLLPQSDLALEQHQSAHDHLRNYKSYISPTSTTPLNSTGADLLTRADIVLFHVSIEPRLFTALLSALVGQETEFFLFLDANNSVTVPVSVDVGSSALLTEILDASLLYRNLSLMLHSAKGNTKLPIKTAFLRFSESYLLRYSNDIDRIFLQKPNSFLCILNSVTPHIRQLRLLSYLKKYFSEASGFNLLSKSFNLSQFGDSEVAQFSSELFQEVVQPYYQYMEHWIIKGELIDEDGEFFVYFDKSKNHINDIVLFDGRLLPKFLDYEDEFFEKILQIGKTLIFLEKYCSELAWTNNFSSRYYTYIFKTYSGLHSMNTNAVQDMILSQFNELTNFLTATIHSKLHFFLHLSNLRTIMFSEAGDFVDAVNQSGHAIFGEPAMNLTPSRLSDLLSSSIASSSVLSLPAEYLNRIDARILDLSHGTIGWDVFTLEYKIPEVPLDSLLNYQNQLTQYLRLFNFLWGLRHFIFLLQQNFVSYQRLRKNELKIIGNQTNIVNNKRHTFGTHNKWVFKSVKTINLMRHLVLHVVQEILRFVSYDLIEKSFTEEIIKKIFRLRSLTARSEGEEFLRLAILNAAFLQECSATCTLEHCETVPKIVHNMNDCTLDDILMYHKNYLLSITASKLLRENMRGRTSGESLVDQVYGFLEVSFSFVQACDQFESCLTQLAGLYQMGSEAEDEIFETYRNLEGVMKIAAGVYKDQFLPKLDIFKRDLRAEPDLKDLSKSL